jgi:hypothetical protein
LRPAAEAGKPHSSGLSAIVSADAYSRMYSYMTGKAGTTTDENEPLIRAKGNFPLIDSIYDMG